MKIVKEIAIELHRMLGRRSTLKLVLLRLRAKVLEDRNGRAFDELHRLMKAYQPDANHDNAGYMIAPAEMTTEECIKRSEEENKTKKPPPGYGDI